MGHAVFSKDIFNANVHFIRGIGFELCKEVVEDIDDREHQRYMAVVV